MRIILALTFGLVTFWAGVCPVRAQAPAPVLIYCGNPAILCTNSGGGGGGGASGTPIQTAVTVGTSSGTLVAAAAFTNFMKVCVAQSAANGIWVNWAGASATLAAPSEFIPPGQCDSWVKASGFLPTNTITAIASVSVAVTVVGN